MTQDEQQDNEQTPEIDRGPTEKLRELEKSEAETLVPGAEVPGAQNPDSEEIKKEKNLNTE
ncbi:MAG: hypothetical protein ACR2HX_02405 [Pyrinomonadaceae bacterium]